MFIITSGEYSDYTVHGYCTTEEKAREYCAKCNSEAPDNYSITEYEEVDCLDLAESVPILYAFHFIAKFDSMARAWKVQSHKYYKNSVIVSRHITDVSRGKDFYDICVTVRENDEELALKAAQDALYKQRALEAEEFARDPLASPK